MKCLVLSGGGEKGVSFLGAIKYLEEIDLISGVETFIGTSAGSIICSLIAIGYTYSEISYILSRINVPSLIPIDDMSIDNFFTNYGFLKHDKLRKVLSVLIDKKTKIQDISLKDVYDKYNKTLYITGSDIQNYECCYFSYKTHPEMKLVDAIIISCSIPLLFEPNIYQSEMYLDGAIFNNYPIKFAKELYSHKDVLGILVYFKRNKHSIKCLEDFLKNVSWNLHIILLMISVILLTIPGDKQRTLSSKFQLGAGVIWYGNHEDLDTDDETAMAIQALRGLYQGEE